MEELWKPVKDFESIYEVSSFGSVRRLDNQRLITPFAIGHGYMQIKLRKPGGYRKNLYVHRIVANAFIQNPLNLREVNHIDGNKENNCVSNLEWVTPHQNRVHCYHVLNRQIGFKKVPVKCVETGVFYPSILLAEKETGATHITDCIHGRCKTSAGLHWELAT